MSKTKRNILYLVIINILIFLFFELSSFLAFSFFFKKEAMEIEISNRLHDAPEQVFIQRNIINKMAGTVRYNFLKNPLVYPDNDLLFRVMPGKNNLGYSGINSDGFRGDNFELANKEKQKTYKIILLGDSCPFGWNLKDYEDTFQYKIEKKFLEAGIPLKIYNLAQPGYSSYQSLLLFEKWLDKINPNFVITYLGWNDIWKTNLLNDRQSIKIFKLTNNVFLKALKKSNMFKLMNHLYLKFMMRTASKVVSKEKLKRVPLKEAKENFDRIIELSNNKNAKTLIILPPFSNKFPSQRMQNYKKFLLKNFSSRVPLIMFTKMEYANPDSYKYFSDGYHPNKLGSTYIANQMFTILNKMILPAP